MARQQTFTAAKESRKLSRKAERDAWTRHITGEELPRPSKWGNERAGRYPSKKQADYATKLYALAHAGQITELEEEVPIILVPGRDGIRPVTYRCDFRYRDRDGLHVVDVKPDDKRVRPAVYRLKKRLALLLLNLEIEEV
jgi:hypothetical protein